MTNSDVDTVKFLGLVVSVIPSPLVQNGIEGDGSLSGLTITNDEFSLSTTNRYHGVDGLETGLYGLVDGAAGQNTRGFDLSTASLGGLDGTLAINGVTEGVNDTSKHFNADWYIDLV